MARKLSFNLAPVEIASKQDLADKPTPESTPSPTSPTHRRHGSKDTICDSSPWINRRVLNGQTEQELRSACRLILQNFKPSDYGMENTDPKLDFGALRPRKESRPQPANVNVRMPTGAPTELALTSFIPRTRSTKTRTRAKADQEIRARQYGDLPVRANSSRKRADFGWLDKRDAEREEKLRTFGKAAIDRSDEDITLPVTVPSNFAHPKLASSVSTSASLPTGRVVTNRMSHHFEDAALAADAQAAEWMRAELEKKKTKKKKQQQQHQYQYQHQQESMEYPRRTSTSSRAASIKESLKEYVFPGSRSRALSRAQSKDSLGSAVDDDDQGLFRHGSSSGWRTWSLRRGKSMRNTSRPGSAKGQANEAPQPTQSESSALNLNRELPPLPSLDSWKDPEKPKEDKAASPKSPIAETHIASLMLSQEHGERSPTGRNHDGKRRSDTLTMQPSTSSSSSSSSSSSNAFPVRQSSRKQASHAQASPSQAEEEHTTTTTTTGCSSMGDMDHQQRSPDAAIHSFSHEMNLDSDTTSPKTTTTTTTPPRDEQKSKLKKIFTGWMHKKDKKDDWMQKTGREGTKEGVLVQQADPLASPVVRY